MGNKILILGATGMLGHDLFRTYSNDKTMEVWGTVRKKKGLPSFLSSSDKIVEGVDAFNYQSIEAVIEKICPDIVVNCIGIIKQLPSSNDPITAITINSLLPHRIARTCEQSGSRLIHISTDCVFSGKDGHYTEESLSDCDDLYGKSKFLGEVPYPNSFTFRTSIIGHELSTSLSLVDWFLNQNGRVKGFDKAIFSGFPTTEIARIIKEYVITHPELYGLYHVSADPINKFDLLNIIAHVYGKKISIDRDSAVSIDRSLDSSRFRQATGYQPPDWDILINAMYKNFISNKSKGQ
ncbi:MAG: SDR family oxidoreductase [Chitinispirillaceae bacterium]|nr:SDR family oxidoreductase [Chitinispirillaceae bacterium]